MGKSNKQIQNINNKKSVNNWKLTDQMLEMMNNEIKFCILHNLLKADFVSHTFTVVLWNSWTSVSQDKMIKQHEDEALKVVLFELLNASFSLFDTMNEQKSHWESFFWKILFSWMRDNETIRNLKLKYCFRDHCYAQTLTQK